MSNLDISIVSLDNLVTNYPKFVGCGVISIRDIGKSRSEAIERTKIDGYRTLDALAPQAFDDMLVLSFDDVWLHEQGGVLPNFMHVATALAWSVGKDRIVVHCTAGISRSSAMAYVVACSRIGVEEAIKKLDFRIHAPNPLIVRIAADLLNDGRIVSEWQKMEKKTELSWVDG